MPLLKLRVWVFDHIRPTDLQVTLFWAGVIGFTGAVSSVLFRRLTDGVHWLLTGQNNGLVESFEHMPVWARILVPALGGAIAGLIIHFGTWWSAKKSSTDYMEAIVLGNGVVPARLSFVKCASAMFTIASGGSIGREGPLVQLSAVLASLIGRMRRMPTLQLRLLVACGAAAGIASAYNAPIGGAMFVAEIVLCSMSMESFGPLVFASVIATLTVRSLLGSDPLYEIHMPNVKLNSNWEIVPYLFLGATAGLAAPWFLRFLRWSETAFTRLQVAPYLKLAAGGLIVGLLAAFHPEICGNGYSVVNEVLNGNVLWQGLLVVLAFKLVATAATFGSGAVGGVFTPTLFTGACIGYLFCAGVQSFWHGAALVPSAFAVVGMGAFLAATTHAPIMAIIILFELTLDYQIILPLMLACVVAHYVSLTFEDKSIYAESLKRKGAGTFEQQLASLSVADLMKKNPVTVSENSRFSEIAHCFITHRFNYLYVVDASQHFKGVISLHDIKGYLNDPELAEIVIARDIMQETFPTVAPYESLAETLTKFSKHDGERLPVTDTDSQLFGTVSKTDVLLALAERDKASSKTEPGMAKAA
ncbi:MAG: ClcB-like voltage-gated chloride channel protein [Chthoniobacteraceae bacterium]